MALFSSARRSPRRLRRNESGYVLLTLLLVVTLMVIAATVVLPSISYEIRRDQEQELIHRGVQYSRAIRSYYKKFGRYPARLEDLENTNNLRFLRKRYKDPLNKNKDFKLLHYGDPGVKLTGTIAGGTIPGANAIGAAPGGPNSSGLFGQSSAFAGNTSGGFGGSSAFGANSNANAGSNASAQNQTSADPSQNPSSANPQDSSSTKIDSAGASDKSSGQQLVSGGPIVGVASVSKKTTIREFNHKKKYEDWQFVYDPTADRGGLITTPYQPALQGFGNQNGQNLQPANQNGSSFGNSFGNSFGQQGGNSNNPNPVGAPTPPTPPPANPPQQQ